MSNIRVIARGKPSATRFELHIPGADLHPHYALAAIFRAGWRGVQKKMQVTIPPGTHDTRLLNTLGRSLEKSG